MAGQQTKEDDMSFIINTNSQLIISEDEKAVPILAFTIEGDIVFKATESGTGKRFVWFNMGSDEWMVSNLKPTPGAIDVSPLLHGTPVNPSTRTKSFAEAMRQAMKELSEEWTTRPGRQYSKITESELAKVEEWLESHTQVVGPQTWVVKPL